MADLITLARLREGVPQAASEDDGWLESLISAASTAIENYCGRHFVAASYTEYFDGRQDGVIVVNEYPIQYVTRIANKPVPAVETYSEAVDLGGQLAAASVRVTSTALVYRSAGINGTDVNLSFPFADITPNQLLSNLKIQVEAAVLYDWQFSILGDFALWPSSYLAVQGPFKLVGQQRATLNIWANEIDPEDVDLESGMVFLGVDAIRRAGQITYRAGWDTVPEDVQQACVSLVAVMLHAANRDTSLKSEKLGDYAYTLMDSSGQLNMPPQSAMLLAPYRSRRIVA